MQYFAYTKVYIFKLWAYSIKARILYDKLKLKAYFNAKAMLEQVE